MTCGGALVGVADHCRTESDEVLPIAPERRRGRQRAVLEVPLQYVQGRDQAGVDGGNLGQHRTPPIPHGWCNSLAMWGSSTLSSSATRSRSSSRTSSSPIRTTSG